MEMSTPCWYVAKIVEVKLASGIDDGYCKLESGSALGACGGRLKTS